MPARDLQTTALEKSAEWEWVGSRLERRSVHPSRIPPVHFPLPPAATRTMTAYTAAAAAYATSLQDIQHKTGQSHKARLEQSLSATAQYLSDFAAAAYLQRDREDPPGVTTEPKSSAAHWKKMTTLCHDRFTDRSHITLEDLHRENDYVLSEVLNAVKKDGTSTSLSVDVMGAEQSLALSTLGLLMIDWQRAGSVPDTSSNHPSSHASTHIYKPSKSTGRFDQLLQDVQDETYRHVAAISQARTLSDRFMKVGTYLSKVASAYSNLSDELKGGVRTAKTVEDWSRRFTDCASKLADSESISQGFANTMVNSGAAGQASLSVPVSGPRHGVALSMLGLMMNSSRGQRIFYPLCSREESKRRALNPSPSPIRQAPITFRGRDE